MPNAFNQLLAGLSGAATGYGQQQDQDIARKRQAALDQSVLTERASQNALRDAQVGNYRSEADARTAKSMANQRAYNALAKAHPDHPLVAGGTGYDDSTDYMSALKESLTKPKTQLIQTNDGLSRVPLDGPPGPVMGSNGQPLGKPAPPPISPYQGEMLELYKQRLAAAQAAAARRAAAPTPDQVKSQTVQSLADPAADALIAYHGGEGGAAPYVSKVASHIPFVGNALANASGGGAAYQTALSNARVLGTQYLEIMPKSRFQPSTIDDIMKQIAPEPGDNDTTKRQKVARIFALKKAIQKRAALRPDAAGTDLTDIPQPPGVDQP